MAGWDASTQENMSEPVGILHTDDKPEIREKKINKKRLEELESNNKLLEIWTKDPKTRTNKKVCAIPLDSAAICCDAIFKAKLAAEKNDEKLKLFDIHYNTQSEENAYRYVLDWVNRCDQEKTVVEVTPPSFDKQEDWQYIYDIIVAADKLEIPTASFGKFLLKKCESQAQDVLPDLDFVAKLFDSDEGVPELGNFAASVIFKAWYNWKLDAEEYDDYMARLQELRIEKSALDEAIHAAVQDKDDFITRAREKKRNLDEQGAAAQGDSMTNSFGENGGLGGAGFDGAGGWPTQDDQDPHMQDNWGAGDNGSGNESSWGIDNDAATGKIASGTWADDANEAANSNTTTNW